MNNWKFIVSMIVLIIIIYLAADFFKPIVNNSKETKDKIDSLNNVIMVIKEHQIKLDSTIKIFSDGINNVDSSIKKIKGQKTIINQIYYEKSNSASSFNNRQIDSFFTDRYGKW